MSVFLALWLPTVGGIALSAVNCGDAGLVYSPITDSCFGFMNGGTTKSWDDALAYCQGLASEPINSAEWTGVGGRLAWVPNNAVADWLFSENAPVAIPTTGEAYWLGLKKQDSNANDYDELVWTDGVSEVGNSMSYTIDDQHIEDETRLCIRIGYVTSITFKRISDKDCTDLQYPLCELYNIDSPEPTTAMDSPEPTTANLDPAAACLAATPHVEAGGWCFTNDLTRAHANHDEAVDACEALGGHLAAVLDPVSMIAIANEIMAGPEPPEALWVNLLQRFGSSTVDGFWAWILPDGTQVPSDATNTDWETGKPNDGDNAEDNLENYGAYRSMYTGLDDVTFDGPVPAVATHPLCQFSLDWTTTTAAVTTTPLDPCSPSPCLNGGTCVGVEGDFFCRCPDTHIGRTCQHTYPDWLETLQLIRCNQVPDAEICEYYLI